MLAKVWKKILLAICIIACIYNVMSKLVNRGSLEANLKKANDGNIVFDFSSKNEITPGVVNLQKSNDVNSQIIDKSTINDDITENVSTDDDVAEEDVENEENEEKDGSSTLKFSDFTFKW